MRWPSSGAVPRVLEVRGSPGRVLAGLAGVALLLSAAGCGGRDGLGDPGARRVGDGGSSLDRSAPDVALDVGVADALPDRPGPDAALDTGGRDAGPDLPDLSSRDLLAVEGHWYQELIGNCINAFDWLSFAPPARVIHTVDDQNFCSEHQFLVDEGGYLEGPERLLELDLPQPGGDGTTGRLIRRRTSAIVDLPDAPPPDFGPRLLMTKAYTRRDARTWIREESDRYLDAAGAVIYRTAGTATLSFDRPPVEPGACSLVVGLTGEAEAQGEDPQQSSDELTVPCRIEPTPSSSWLTVAVDVGGDWFNYLSAKGFYQRHPSRAAQAMTDVFRPVLMLDPAHPEQPLFEINSLFTYSERLSGPQPPPP